MPNHDTVIVRKPWGYEYLVYKNTDVALWLLHINPGERTSMHCHPNKSTGLVVLDGTAEINFIADSKQLHAPAKQMIRRGLFHQTHAVSDTPVLMFEIETPVDKDDLVRLHDNYGRKNSGYEDSKFELPKTTDCLWIDSVSQTYSFANRLITVELVSDNNILDNKNPTDIIVFLQGGVVKTVNHRKHNVIKPGDVGIVQVVQQVAKEMDGFTQDSIIMTIK